MSSNPFRRGGSHDDALVFLAEAALRLLAAFLPGKEDVESVRVAWEDIDTGIHPGSLEVPHIVKCLVIERFPVQDIGIAGRKSGIVRRTGGRSIGRYIGSAAKTAQVHTPPLVVPFRAPGQSWIVGR